MEQKPTPASNQFPVTQKNSNNIPTVFVQEQLGKVKLSADVKEIALAVVSGKILKHYLLPDLMDALGVLIRQTHIHAGTTFNEANFIPAFTEVLATDMAIEYGGLTFGEIEIAFKRGWKGNYGEYMGLNNKTFFKWIKAYSQEESRIAAKKAIEKAQKEYRKPPELSEQEKEEQIKNGIIYIFNKFKDGGTCIIPSALYDYLQRRLIINYTPERKEQFMSLAKTELHEEKLEEKFTESTKDAVNRYLSELDEQNNIHVINRAKAIAVRVWFLNIIEMEEDINELLTQKPE